jgi:hypothetical protein
MSRQAGRPSPRSNSTGTRPRTGGGGAAGVIATEPPDRGRAADRAEAADALQWSFIRTSLAEAATRFAALLRSVPDVDVPAIGTWTIGDTAAHVRVVSLLNSILACGATPPAGMEEIVERTAHATIRTVGPDVNQPSVNWEQCRDPAELARLIEGQIGTMLDDSTRLRGSDTVHWLGGLPLPRSAVFVHMLSELLVHGHDIATAARCPYELPAADARLYFDCLLPEVVCNADSVGFFGPRDTTESADVSWQLRVRGLPPRCYAIRDGHLSVAKTPLPVDLRLSVEPVAMLLVMFNRISPAGPALRGQLRVWGRRPWRVGRLMKAMQTP